MSCWQKPWMVEHVMSSMAASAASSDSFWGSLRPSGRTSFSSAGMSPPSMREANSRTRKSSSLAASSVNVTAAMALGSVPCMSSIAMRPASTAVLPDPAPASTSRVRSCAVSAFCRA
ncbi:hypothetical protein D9M69_597310 [compost metagenome]